MKKFSGDILNITENTYYDLMCEMSVDMNFDELHRRWLSCFFHILKSFKVGYTYKVASSLFLDFHMLNWIDLHKENSEYKDLTKKELIESFCGECHYICDRANYDRLFRTHWLFIQAFNNELDGIRYGDVEIELNDIMEE